MGEKKNYSTSRKKQSSLMDYPAFVLMDDKTLNKRYAFAFLDGGDDAVEMALGTPDCYIGVPIGSVVDRKFVEEIADEFSETYSLERLEKDGHAYIPIRCVHSADDLIL
ncbi:hypothetical protein DMB44_04240 [Thermoplasma sp. Kam2015]|nr:hypothetical protein DMB44_04240 [Thermoplasma sp. Kam2015]